MITFKLLDDTTSKETVVQINPNHIVTVNHTIDTDYIEQLGCVCHLAYTNYEFVTGMQLNVCIVEPEQTFARDDFIDYVANGLNFNVTFINWSK